MGKVKWYKCPRDHPVASSAMSCCLICREESFDYKTPCEHQFHMECFEPWYKNNKICPYCGKAIKHFKKKLKLLSKTCERCGNGPSNFVTRCHHFIHTRNCTSKKIPYRKCPICNMRISSNQRTEILESQHVWSNDELEVDMPITFLELAIMICENEKLMEKIPLDFIVKKLSKTGFVINQCVKTHGFSLMNCACKGQNVAAIKQLTLLGSKICIYYSFSPVNYAVRSSNVDLLNFLVDHGVNIKGFPDEILYIALADLNENGRMFERLVELGKDPKKYKYWDDNLLMRAVRTKFYNAVVKLVDNYGFNVNEVKSLAFLCTGETEDLRIIDFLIERGANTRHMNILNQNAFQLACMTNARFERNQTLKNEIIRKLFDIIKPDPNFKDKYGKTTLTYAASTGNLDVFNFLIEKGADLRCRNHDGSYPINYAILYGRDHIVNRILELGFSIKDLNENLIMPPLHFMAMKCYFCSNMIQEMQKLSELGVDFSSRDLQGRTSLHVAAANRNLEFMEILIKECGLDINDKDYDLRRPIDLVYDERAISWLLDHGSMPKRKWYEICFPCCMN